MKKKKQASKHEATINRIGRPTRYLSNCSAHVKRGGGEIWGDLGIRASEEGGRSRRDLTG